MTTTLPPAAPGPRSAQRQSAQAAATEATARAADAVGQIEHQAALRGLELEDLKAAARLKRLADKADAKLKRRAARDKARAEAADRKAKRKAAAVARRAEQATGRAWRVYRRATLALVAASALAALPMQEKYFAAFGVLPLLAVPLAVEGLAWVMAAGQAAAVEAGRPTGIYRLWMLLGAVFAARVNYVEGAHYGQAVGWGLAATSVIGPLAWELLQISTKYHASGRTAADVACALRRWFFHPRLSLRASRLLAGGGVTDPAAAWMQVWLDAHGADVGTTARSLARQASARQRLADARAQLASAEAVEKAAVGADIGIDWDADGVHEGPEVPVMPSVPALVWPTPGSALEMYPLPWDLGADTRTRSAGPRGRSVGADADSTTAQVSTRIPPADGKADTAKPARPDARAAADPTGERPGRRSGAARRHHAAARRAASLTAKKAASETDEMEAKRKAAREEIRQLLDAGETPSPAVIGRKYALSPDWGSKQIKAVKGGA